jgi:hypothetical protein
MRFGQVFAVTLGLLVLGACSDTTQPEPEPEPTPTPACQVNNTADVYFKNVSNTNSTYDIVWDGSKIATVTPGDSSSTFTVAAGVQHTLLFKFTNTNNAACNQGTPVLAQCQTHWFSCTG